MRPARAAGVGLRGCTFCLVLRTLTSVTVHTAGTRMADTEAQPHGKRVEAVDLNLTNASRTLNAWCYYDFLSVDKALRCDKHQFRDKNDGEQLNRF